MTEERLKKAKELQVKVNKLKAVYERLDNYLSKSSLDDDDSYYIDTEPLAYAKKIILDNLSEKIKLIEKEFEDL